MPLDSTRFGADGFRQVVPDASELRDDLPKLPLLIAEPLFHALSKTNSPFQPSTLATTIKRCSTVFESIDGSATILVVKPASFGNASIAAPTALRLKKLDGALVLTEVAPLRSGDLPCSPKARDAASGQVAAKPADGGVPARSYRDIIEQKRAQAAALSASHKTESERHEVTLIIKR